MLVRTFSEEWLLSVLLLVLSGMRGVAAQETASKTTISHLWDTLCNKRYCPSSPRCGWFGLSTLMNTGGTTMQGCKESCVFLPIVFRRNMKCGDCVTASPTVAPATASPTTASPTLPPAAFQFNLTIDVAGALQSETAVILQAAKRWERVIYGDLQGGPTTGLNPPSDPNCTLPAFLDDVYVCLSYDQEPSDGVGNALASSVITAARNTGQSAVGEISIDSADVANMKATGQFFPVLLHEMGHILGIGPLWKKDGLVIDNSTDPMQNPQCRYIGAHANAEYKKISGCEEVPLELEGGAGSACTHFDETALQTELMTSQSFAGELDKLSRITIGALEDLGYLVDYNSADKFTTSDLGPGAICTKRRSTLRSLVQGSWKQLSSVRNGRKLISNELRDYAIQRGQSILQMKKLLRENNAKSALKTIASVASTSSASGFFIPLDNIVSVVVSDGEGNIFSVLVTDNGS